MYDIQIMPLQLFSAIDLKNEELKITPHGCKARPAKFELAPSTLPTSKDNDYRSSFE